MSYNPINWVNGETPINDTNLNNMDQGIADAHSMLAEHESKIDDFFNQQLPEEYVKEAVDTYVENNSAGFATAADLEEIESQLDSVNSEVGELSSEIANIVSTEVSVNRFNKDAILVDTFYKNVDGIITPTKSTGYVAFLLEVEADKKYTVSGTSYSTQCVGDNMEYLGYSYNSGITTFDTSLLSRKAELKYLSISFKPTSYPINTYMAVEGDTLPTKYVPYVNEKRLNSEIVVDYSQIRNAQSLGKVYAINSDGSGDYATFTECIRALKNDSTNKTIYIEGGEYDLFEEIGGADYVASLVGATSWKEVCDIVPPNTNIIGKGNVVFNFNPTGEQITSEVASLLSPLNVTNGVHIENLMINADNCRYCIHDETGGDDTAIGSKHVYKNVRLNKKRTNYGIDCAFGCGTNKGQVMEFDNCNFYSNDRALSIHNKGGFSVDNTIINIKNSILRVANESNRALNLRNVNGVQAHIYVNMSNSYIDGEIKIQNETETERPNAFDLTVSGCGEVNIVVENETNVYTPNVYI